MSRGRLPIRSRKSLVAPKWVLIVLSGPYWAALRPIAWPRWNYRTAVQGPVLCVIYNPEGPGTQYLRTLVPNIIKFGIKDFKYWVLGPSGQGS